MKRREALRILSENREEIGRFGVAGLAIFGSVARDEAGPESDVDVLVELDPEARVGLFEFVRLKMRLEELLGCPVDLVTSDSLKERLRDKVLEEAVPAN